MRKHNLIILLGLLLLPAGAADTARAEVKRIEMRIAGYLCGN